jgi:hypothetical protein
VAGKLARNGKLRKVHRAQLLAMSRAPSGTMRACQGSGTVTTHSFDDRNILWSKLEGFEHLEYFIYDVDEENRIVDILFKFAANKQIVLHWHKAD